LLTFVKERIKKAILFVQGLEIFAVRLDSLHCTPDIKDFSNSKRRIHGNLSTYFTTVLISTWAYFIKRVFLVLSNTMLKINENILTLIQDGIYEGK
jgi:hypothetical protein